MARRRFKQLKIRNENNEERWISLSLLGEQKLEDLVTLIHKIEELFNEDELPEEEYKELLRRVIELCYEKLKEYGELYHYPYIYTEEEKRFKNSSIL